MPLTNKEIEQRIKAFEYGGYDSVVAEIDGELLTWGDESTLISNSFQTLVRFIDRIQASYPALADELKKMDAEYMKNKPLTKESPFNDANGGLIKTYGSSIPDWA